MKSSGEGHGGNLRKLSIDSGIDENDILDFSANINPLGFPEWLRPLISSRVSDITKYPDPYCEELTTAVAEKYGAGEEAVVAGNGATEILYAIPGIGNFDKAVVPEPAYIDYRRLAEKAGLDVATVQMCEEDDFTLDYQALESTIGVNDLVIIGHPNNPTGRTVDAVAIRDIALRKPDSLFVVDESFGGFVENFESLAVDRPANVIVVISLTKLFAIPGLRLGVALADEAIATRLRDQVMPWSVNVLAQAVGVEAMKDDGYVSRAWKHVAHWRGNLMADLETIDALKVFESDANYLLLKINQPGMTAGELAKLTLKDGVAIRVCENYTGLDDKFFRVAVRNGKENEKLVASLRKIFKAPAGKKRAKKKPAIMIQGVSSDSGKSVINAALCRILKQDGYDVAPFKAQNMALNSYVTINGEEIGRAQVTQAQACGLEPDTRMNPILLKPNSDTGSQVVVMGKPVGAMNVSEYIDYQKEGFKIVKRAYDDLSADHDVIIMEGAGSPGEMNLKKRDIVNMRMARYADAKVLIVGDIDRGGVFASFVGIMETLNEWERKLTAGFIINKFRGDASLLDAAIEYVDRACGKPTLGVVPFIRPIGLPEEDRAVAPTYGGKNGGDSVTVAILKLRHVSNFTDFDPLAMERDVAIVEAYGPDDLDDVDCVIIPGSKNVIGDIEHIYENGVVEKLKEIAGNGKTEIVGICGGYQMMGEVITDPHGIESNRGSIEGIGILPLKTTIEKEKTLARVQAVHAESDLAVHGYEIHHGVTEYGAAKPVVTDSSGAALGVGSDDGRNWGSYIHGIFNDDKFRRWFIDKLRVRKGFAALGKSAVRYDIDKALDDLADTVRGNIDMDKIYQIIDS